jgi:hypothetical protein
MLRTLKDAGFSLDPALFEASVDLYHGDLVSVGRGEILFLHREVA